MNEKKIRNSETDLRRIPPRINSETLLAGSQVLQIEHMGELYILRSTSNGKLILTK